MVSDQVTIAGDVDQEDRGVGCPGEEPDHQQHQAGPGQSLLHQQPLPPHLQDLGVLGHTGASHKCLVVVIPKRKYYQNYSLRI